MPPSALLYRTESTRAIPARAAPDHAWRLLGWFGSLLTIVGLVDICLVWYPFRMGNPEWEFAAVDFSFSSLPLLTMGLAALLASAIAREHRGLTRAVGFALILLALVVMGAYSVFLTDVPIALRVAPGPVAVGIKKAIVKTSVFAFAFSIAYLVAGISAIRHLRRSAREYRQV